jgi:PAS domain S-box-containing protein
MELFSGTVPVYILPPLISLVFSIILIFVVLARGRLQSENVLFALICFIWAILYFVFISHHLFADERLLLKIERTVHFFFVYVAAVNVIFIHRITGTKRRFLEIILLVLTFIISLSTQTEHYITGLHKYSWGYIAKSGVFFNIFSAISVMITLYIIIISYRCFRSEKNEIRRLKVKYIFTGFVFTAFLTLFNIPAMHGIDFYPIGNYSFIPLTIMAYGLLKYDLIDVNQLLLKSMVWVLSLIMVSIPIGVFAYLLATQRGPFDPVISAILLALSGIIIMIYTRFVQPRIDIALQSKAFDYRRLADEFTSQMIRLKSMDGLIAAIFTMLKTTIGPSNLTFISRKEGGPVFTTFADYNATCTGEWVISPEDQEMIALHQGVLEKEQIELNPRFENLRDCMARYFQICECIAAIPVAFEGRLLGAINIGKKTTGSYSRLEVEFLEMLAPGINIAISNSVHLGRFQDLNLFLEEKVRERTAMLNESELKYRNLIENANDIINTCDVNGKITFMNTLGLSLLGYSAGEICEINVLDLVHPDMRDEMRAFYTRQIRERIPETYREFVVDMKNGDTIWVGQKTRLMSDGGRVTGFYSISRNITVQKKAEEALRENEEKYRHIVDNVTDAIYTLDGRGYFIFANRASLTLCGYGMDELRTMRFTDILAPDSLGPVREFVEKQTREYNPDYYMEFQFVRKDGSTVWVGQTTRHVKLKNGSAIFHSIARDISGRKKAEDERRELEEQKTLFFSNISHEIRTPLTLILSPLESYLQGDYSGEPGRPFFENLYRNGLRLFKLINNLLDFSKIEAGRMVLRVSEADISGILKNYIASVRSTAELRGIKIDLLASPRKVENLFIDVEKIDRIFMNLLSNALKFTDRGGAIEVRLHDDEVFCYVEIEDTGCGIPGDKLGTVFDRFSQADASSTRKHEGTGIGLALAKELAEMHGGNITVRSRHEKEYPDNHGSVFTVTLLKGKEHFSGMDNVFVAGDGDSGEPVYNHRFTGMNEMLDLAGNDATAETSPGCAGGESRQDRQAVLVADDNEDMRTYLARMLEKDYLVYTAENGAVALEKTLEHRPDILITDVMMPVMDGYELAGRVKGNPAIRHIPIIMLTAKAELVNKVEGFERGADDYLVKPFNSRELLARVGTLLRSSGYQRIIARRNIEIEQELDVARLILNKLLPQEIPPVEGYTPSVTYLPMDKVGGDFYDYLHRDGAIQLFIADVSGHGLHAAFLALITKMALDSVFERSSPAAVIGAVNSIVCRSTVRNNYVTAFCGSLDTENRILKYCNAGHCSPLVYRKKTGEFIELKTQGKPLGWFKSPEIEEREIPLHPGDRLVLYTDGITECFLPGGELFGDERLQDFIAANSGEAPDAFSDRLIRELKSHCGAESFNDDLTLIVLDLA